MQKNSPRNDRILSVATVTRRITEWKGDLFMKRACSIILIAVLLVSMGHMFPVKASANSNEASVIDTPMYSKAIFSEGVCDLGEDNTGVQVVKLDVIPGYHNIDALIVYLDSDDDTTNFAFSKMTTSFRFNPGGYFDVKNGSPWDYETRMSYRAGETYHVKMVIDIPKQQYSIWVTPNGGSPVIIADQYSFREGTSADDIGQLMLQSAADDLIVVTKHTLVGESVFHAAIDAVNRAMTAAEMRMAVESANLALTLDLYESLEEDDRMQAAQTLIDRRDNGYHDDLAIQAALDDIILEMDTDAPSDPYVLSGYANQSFQVKLEWDDASDHGGSGIEKYIVYRDDEIIASTSLTSYVDSRDLIAGASHTIR